MSSIARSIKSASATIDGPTASENATEEIREQSETNVVEPVTKRRNTQAGLTKDSAGAHNAGKAQDIHAAVPVLQGELLRSASTVASRSVNSPFTRSTRSRRRTSGPAFVQIAEDPRLELESEIRGQTAGDEIQNSKIAGTVQVEEAEVDKENASPEMSTEKNGLATAEKTKRKPKKRRSIGQQSGRRKKRLSNTSVQTGEDQPTHDIRETAYAEEESPEWETMIEDRPATSPVQVASPVQEPESVQRKEGSANRLF